jgi:hypothetical protein
LIVPIRPSKPWRYAARFAKRVRLFSPAFAKGQSVSVCRGFS